MKKAINREHIEGYVYEHNLAIKTVQNTESKNYGKEFINGTLDIQTDEAGINVVTVTFTYVTEVTLKGTKNETYATLKNIIENGKTVLVDGKDAATMVRIDTALGLNDFYTSRNGEETLVSVKKNDGGFVHATNKLGEEATRNTFEFDMLINGTRLVEADEEKHIDTDELIVKTAGGIKYFESLDASPSNLVFKRVWGKIESQTIVDRREEESAFGDAAVKEYTRTIREWVITGTAKETYEIDDEKNGITTDEIKTAMADREVYLADVKKRADEYQASKAANMSTTATPSAGTTAAAGGFNF